MSTHSGHWPHSAVDSGVAGSFDRADPVDPPPVGRDQNARERAFYAFSSTGSMAGEGFDKALGSSPKLSAQKEPTLLAVRCLQLLTTAWSGIWAKIESRRMGQGRRSLRVVETVGLGEKRFVAIVQVQEARFLIGGGSAGVSLLARLDAAQPFAAVLEEQADAFTRVDAKRIREAW